jgi:hypothetical protein
MKRSFSVRLTAGFMAVLLGGLFIGLMIQPVRNALASGIAPGAYNLIQDEAVSLAKRSTVNFTGPGIGCADDVVNNRTNCDVPGTGMLFSSVANAGPNNTATETSLIGTLGIGSTTIPANTFSDGSIMEARAQGFFSLPAVADTLTLKMKCGATVLASTSFTPAAGTLTNPTFRFWLMITGRGTGAGGSLMTNGQVDFSTGITTTGQAVLNTSAVAFDFTTACAFDITAQWGAGQVGELMTATNAAAWLPRAGAATAVAGGYNTVEDEGVPLPQRTTLNCTGAGIACSDAGGKTVINVPGGGGSVTLTPPYIDDGAGNFYGPVFTLIKPGATTFAWRNQGTATVASTNGMVFINSGAGTGGYDWRIRETAAPAAPYTITVGGNCQNIVSTQLFCGPVLVESGTGKFISFGLGFSLERVNVDTWNSVTSNAGNQYDGNVQVDNWSYSGMWFFRIVDDGATRAYSVSKDGINFIEVLSGQANNFFIVADQLGFGVAQNVGATGFTAMSVFHFSITTP